MDPCSSCFISRVLTYIGDNLVPSIIARGTYVIGFITMRLFSTLLLVVFLIYGISADRKCAEQLLNWAQILPSPGNDSQGKRQITMYIYFKQYRLKRKLILLKVY